MLKRLAVITLRACETYTLLNVVKVAHFVEVASVYEVSVVLKH